MMDLILKNWRFVGSFLAMAAVLGWFTWQDYRVTTLKRELQTAQASVASYQEGLTVLQADTKAKIDALEAESDRQISRTRNMERLLGRIEGANDEKDGPVAPVLRDTIDGLYGANSPR